MPKLIFNGSREGLEKYLLTKLQVQMLRIPLSESKRNVDALLDGHPVIIEIENPDLAKEFLNEAEKLGLDAALIDT